MRKLFAMTFCLMLFSSLNILARSGVIVPKEIYGYLYCHMSDEGEWTSFALSRDGVHWHDLNFGEEVYDTKALSRIEHGARDAFITRAYDGKSFVMLTTDMLVAKSNKWDNYGIDLLKSNDLIHWTSVTFDFRKGSGIFCDPQSEDTYKDYSTIHRVWAPQCLWDESYVWSNGEKGGYFVYYSMLNDKNGEDKYDRIYYSYADKSFTKLTKPRLLFDWGYATIDADINYVEADGMYHILLKKEGGQRGIFTSKSKSLTGPWQKPDEKDYISFEGRRLTEGPSAWQVAGEDGWRIGYVEYSSMPHKYRICKADKYLSHFNSPEDIKGVSAPQHGSFIPLTKEEYQKLDGYWTAKTIIEKPLSYSGYLFAYFEGSGEKKLQENLRFAVSSDAKNWHALNGNVPVVMSDTISETGGIRDPHILRGVDGKCFYIVATDMNTCRDGWKKPNPGIVLMKSDDLIHWTHSRINLAKAFPDNFADTYWVWAPQTIYDRKSGKYVIYFSIIKKDKSVPQTTYYAFANKDFTGFEGEPKVLFKARYGSIDNDIIFANGLYHLFYKGWITDGDGNDLKTGILQATSRHLLKGWRENYAFLDAYQGKTAVEGSSIFKLNGKDEYVLMYDVFGKGRYEYQTTTDLIHFSSTPQSFNKDFNPRHGSVISLTDEEMKRLEKTWGTNKNVRKLDVDTRKTVNKVPPTLWGIFFEDINFAADAGLYAELIENRSFEYPQHLMGWQTMGNVNINNVNPAFDRNPHYASLRYPGSDWRLTALENHGYFGIGVKKDSCYIFTVYARKEHTDSAKARLEIELFSPNGGKISRTTMNIDSESWKKYSLKLKANVTEEKAFLRLTLKSRTGADIDHVSLMPANNWHGLRADLVKDLAELHPGVMRFPGGFIVEGIDMTGRYQWKNSVGPVENRPLNENPWNFHRANRLAPEYYQSLGLGFYEYFLLAEHIGAEPLPILNCGMSYTFDKEGAKNSYAPMSDINQYIQDAIDLIEFANGPVTSKWGALRAKMGHKEPFKMKYIGIGNEVWGDLYNERLKAISEAVRKHYPKMKIVAYAQSISKDGKTDFEYDPKRKVLSEFGIDIADEHHYKDPKWFTRSAALFDSYPRKGSKIYLGEYACHKNNRNSFTAALSEAAFLTGVERNCDLVQMSSYAPLFSRVDHWQWRPNLIWFDNMSSVRTVNWYVQQMFSNNAGTDLLKITENGKPLTGQDGLYASAVKDSKDSSIIIKVVNITENDQQVKININGLKKHYIIETTTLHSDDMESENNINDKGKVLPVSSKSSFKGSDFTATISGQSFVVFRIHK